MGKKSDERDRLKRWDCSSLIRSLIDKGKSLLLSYIYYVRIIYSKILWNVYLWLICEIMIEFTLLNFMILYWNIFPILWTLISNIIMIEIWIMVIKLLQIRVYLYVKMIYCLTEYYCCFVPLKLQWFLIVFIVGSRLIFGLKIYLFCLIYALICQEHSRERKGEQP